MGHGAGLHLETYAHVIDALGDVRYADLDALIASARQPTLGFPRVPERPTRDLPLESRKAAVSSGFARALCRTRTGDPFLTMEVLYQLS